MERRGRAATLTTRQRYETWLRELLETVDSDELAGEIHPGAPPHWRVTGVAICSIGYLSAAGSLKIVFHSWNMRGMRSILGFMSRVFRT
jgi:hypothetical protein